MFESVKKFVKSTVEAVKAKAAHYSAVIATVATSASEKVVAAAHKLAVTGAKVVDGLPKPVQAVVYYTAAIVALAAAAIYDAVQSPAVLSGAILVGCAISSTVFAAYMLDTMATVLLEDAYSELGVELEAGAAWYIRVAVGIASGFAALGFVGGAAVVLFVIIASTSLILVSRLVDGLMTKRVPELIVI